MASNPGSGHGEAIRRASVVLLFPPGTAPRNPLGKDCAMTFPTPRELRLFDQWIQRVCRLLCRPVSTTGETLRCLSNATNRPFYQPLRCRPAFPRGHPLQPLLWAISPIRPDGRMGSKGTFRAHVGSLFPSLSNPPKARMSGHFAAFSGSMKDRNRPLGLCPAEGFLRYDGGVPSSPS